MKKKSKKTAKHRGLSKKVQAAYACLHSVSVGSPLVIDFGDPALREAFRRWWHPYDMGPNFDALTGQDGVVVRVTHHTRRGGRGTIKRIPATHPVARGDTIERRRLDPGYYRRIDHALNRMRSGRKHLAKKRDLPSAKRAPVKVLITLTYPLAERRSKLVTIDRRYPGEIFALTHDFYRELYTEDEKRGGEAGPMRGGRGPILNRGRDPLVWGHDLGDLVFEGCHYRALDRATAERTGAEGEFTFSIGS
jgi:hypothetical protein